MKLRKGIYAQKSYKVTKKLTTDHLDGVPMLSTPSLISLIEYTALDLVQPYLSEEESTVGTYLDISHLAPTKMGEKVEVIVTLEGVDDAKLLFGVAVFDKTKKIAEGAHERFIVNKSKFLKML